MIKIPDLVEQLIKERPFLEKMLEEGLINSTALARTFQPEISKRLGRPVQSGAIVMAIKRLALQPQLSPSHQQRLADNLGDLILRSNLADYTFANSSQLMTLQNQLARKIEQNEQWFYTFSRGVFESTLVLSQALIPKVEMIFASEKLIWKSFDLSAITLKLKQGNTHTPGLYYHVLKTLAWQNINIVEVISTSNEFTLILEEPFVDKAFSALKKLNKQLHIPL
jgi:hypothetical protein